MKSLNKKCMTVVLALSVLTGWVHAEVEPLDRVVAVVDEGVVMESELKAKMRGIVAKLRASDTELPPEDVLQAQVLDHLVNEQIQLQMAKRAGANVSATELDQMIERIRASNNLSQAEFLQGLAAEGLSIAELREDLRREMLVRQVQQGSVNRRIQVTESEINNFLNSTEGKFWTSPDYHLGHILVAVPSGSSEAEIAKLEAKANALREEALAGADFRRLAVANSAGQNALEGGDLGWRKLAQLPTLFADHVDGLKTGDVTKPFRSGAGFHLIKLHEQRGGGEVLIEQTKARHILIKTSEVINDTEAFDRLTALRTQIIEGADFAELAKANSEDLGSALQGGDLGWANPGQFVPAFEETMQQMAPGEISQPFRSQFGWHILQVLERRKQDMSDNMMKNQAANLLRSRRFEEELQVWLQEIRDEAYVELKL
ncbi:peptidylprolyl isomerase [Simiduia aestuariiviva]|uniref:Chaperone SurA n=1 Tax=Simiduia aestuariiviva TaxID=1510459 RepID=A0A839UL00_9GAMM|nr:peptidylprolyl isomerase [Simiduia aestuariiviva]MBB3167270.1 peptidyl-prolyl cis-trans isomerase SurA [Simiduia aestuariiviva]